MSEQSTTPTTDPQEPGTTTPETTTPDPKTTTSGQTTTPDGEKTAKDPSSEPKDEAKPEDAKPLAATDLQMPEGFAPPEARMNAVLEFANEHGIPADVVNKFLGLEAEWAKEAAKAAGPSFEETVQGWREQSENLPNIGGENLEATMAKVNTFVGEMTEGFSDDFDRMLEMTGVGNHPLMVRFLHNAAERLGVGEGKPAAGTTAVSAREGAAKRMFPSMKNE